MICSGWKTGERRVEAGRFGAGAKKAVGAGVAHWYR
jgi:hypothetical protein